MTARVSMLLKSRGSLTCFRASFLPGRAKDLSAPRYALVTCRISYEVAVTDSRHQTEGEETFRHDCHFVILNSTRIQPQ